MREVMTKTMARNIFYGGSLFFILIFVGLTIHSHVYITTTSTASMPLTESVARGNLQYQNEPVALPFHLCSPVAYLTKA